MQFLDGEPPAKIWYGPQCVPEGKSPKAKESTVRNWLMGSLVIAALTFSPNALFAPFHEASIAYAAEKEPFSRGVALRACQAEARKKSLASGFSREVALYGNASSESVQLTELVMQSRDGSGRSRRS